jgi:hypothetical protein
VTATSATPVLRDPVTAVSELALTKVTFLASTPPMVTVAVASNRCPLIVTVVPPIDGPLFGLIDETTGPVAGGLGAVGLPPHAAASSIVVSATAVVAYRAVLSLMRG